MSRARRPRPRLALGRVVAVTASVAALTVALAAAPAQARTVVTPGDLTGYGFDQCTAPSQRAMDAWLTGSSYWAVGIYISGASRGCVHQPNLSRTWVSTQVRNGWRLLPITLGPQAWCTTRERYLHQVRISPSPTNTYAKARSQGRAEARKTLRRAQGLGIGARSTLWYDLEAFDTSGTRCRESATWFLSAWTAALHRHHYVSGVYSSAASGIRMLDDARVGRPGVFHLPDRVWIADWNGHPTTRSSYVRSSGWTPHRRVHQYRGGHQETHGGVTIDVDTDWVDLGHGSRVAAEPAHCGGRASWDRRSYPRADVGDHGALVRTAQCLLQRKSAYDGAIDGVYDSGFAAAVRRYRVGHGLPTGSAMTQRTWVTLLAQGETPVLKRGSAGTAVRRLQRALNAADGVRLPITGIFGRRTGRAVRAYQREQHHSRTAVVADGTWRLLQSGRS